MTIAGIGSRALAWLLDGFVIGFAYVMVGVIATVPSRVDDLLRLGLISVAVLVIPLLYLVGFETLNGGRTLGKWAAGIKVVRSNGAPVGFAQAIVRALFALVDFGFLGVGIITMFVTARSQRLGDLAASTVVVRERIPATAAAAPAPTLPEGRRWDVSGVTDTEVGVIRTFLERAAGLDHSRRVAMASELRSKIAGRVGGVEVALPDELFLSRVVAEKLTARS
jgi:uncharacterized RDD family membrane protein YckC